VVKKVRISQQQIACDLGLSQTLVSMVLNGRRTGISEESYEKIWTHARRVGYRPKGMDPDMIRSGSVPGSVGFILRAGLKLHTQSPFFSHVQQGLHEHLQAQGVTLLFLGSEEHLDVSKMKAAYGDRQMFRGLVILGEVSRAFLHSLKQLEPRIVSVSAQYSGLCHSVLYNEVQAGEQIAQHVAALGHRDIAWLGGSRGTQRSRQRNQALASALRLRNLRIQPNFEIELDGADRLDGRDAAQRILKAAGKKHRPTAWVCFNGTMARGATNYLLQQGVRVPQDVSIVAFDRSRIGVEEHPTLTSAGAEPEKMGVVAAELLLKSTGEANEMFSDVVLASELIERESTAPLKKTR
jgi:LacI family transcriptional regulator